MIKVVLADGKVVHKLGRTVDLNRRFKELRRLIPGDLELLHQTLFTQHEFLEICAKSVLAKRRFDKFDLTEIYAAELPHIVKVLKACKRKRKELEKLE